MVRTGPVPPDGVAIDLTARAIDALAACGPCDGIVHLASQVDLSKAATEASFFAASIGATTALATLAGEWKAHLVLASSTAVLGMFTSADATSATAPLTAYGRTKLLAERIAQSSEVSHAVLRIGGVFGRKGPSHLGLNRAIDRAIDAAEAPAVIGRGTARRNYVYVADLADIIVECVRNRIHGTHLVGGAQALSIREMMVAVCAAFLPGKEPRFESGSDASDQVLTPSPALPAGRSFEAALRDIGSRA